MTTWTKEQEAEALRKRFESLKKEKGISRAAFARNFEIKGGDSMINQHITGHRPLSKDAAIAYAKGFGCTLSDISPRLASEAEELAAFIEGESIRIDEKAAPFLPSTATFQSARDRRIDELLAIVHAMSDDGLLVLTGSATEIAKQHPAQAKQTPESTG